MGVLDWEIAHLGDVEEDFGWLCINSWRFGKPEKEVGGFGDVGELLAGYTEAGGPIIDDAALRWWQIFGSVFGCSSGSAAARFFNSLILAREVAPDLLLRSNYTNYVGCRSELHQNHVNNLRGWDHGDDGHLPPR